MANPILIYDDACPMCKGYTSAFKHMGWSDRMAFSKLPKELMEKLDIDRARHEIPLLDAASGVIKYGLDSQIAVLEKGMPYLRPVLHWPVLKYLLKPLYNLITYNRRVIAGTRPPEHGFDCAPDFNHFWRLTYLLLAAAAIVGLATLTPLMLLSLLVTLVAGLCFASERMTWTGNVLTIALMASILGLCLPAEVVAIVMGVEIYRRLM